MNHLFCILSALQKEDFSFSISSFAPLIGYQFEEPLTLVRGEGPTNRRLPDQVEDAIISVNQVTEALRLVDSEKATIRDYEGHPGLSLFVLV